MEKFKPKRGCDKKSMWWKVIWRKLVDSQPIQAKQAGLFARENGTRQLRGTLLVPDTIYILISGIIPMKPKFDWIHLQSKVFPRAMVSHLFGTRGLFCGRHFFPWTKAMWTMGSSCKYIDSPATHLLLCSRFLTAHGPALVCVWGVGDPCPRTLVKENTRKNTQ